MIIMEALRSEQQTGNIDARNFSVSPMYTTLLIKPKCTTLLIKPKWSPKERDTFTLELGMTF
jgi:hypothetical protein